MSLAAGTLAEDKHYTVKVVVLVLPLMTSSTFLVHIHGVNRGQIL